MRLGVHLSVVILLGRFQHLASLIPRSVVRLPFLRLDIVIGPLGFPIECSHLGFGPDRVLLAIIH
jgi:hypothetical protein